MKRCMNEETFIKMAFVCLFGEASNVSCFFFGGWGGVE